MAGVTHPTENARLMMSYGNWYSSETWKRTIAALLAENESQAKHIERLEELLRRSDTNIGPGTWRQWRKDRDAALANTEKPRAKS